MAHRVVLGELADASFQFRHFADAILELVARDGADLQPEVPQEPTQ
ncbi:hypothetical protein J2Z19_004658 [Ensifer adhaerens]|uniref:Uncharacterized protein n=1 Tax=Ensifer adhaerens TaxID=106592 RepID=A0ACC5T1I2_ENSAD|nr:hypothetical protein [Ensifer adhaerens]MBP1874925.1 hypothetical protein [Ensifer adhaerens]